MLKKREDQFEEFEWAFGLNKLSLTLMGIWPEDRRESLDVILRVPFMIFSIFFFLFLPQMYALALVINELPLVIDNLMTSCAGLASCVKLFFLWKSKTALRPIIQTINEDWLCYKTDWELQTMKREASRARVFTMSGYVIITGCYAGFSLAPVFGINIRMISNITDKGLYLLIQSYYPYDYSKSPLYEITLASQLISGFFVGMSVSIPDNYFAALVFHVGAQFEILGKQFENSMQKDSRTSKVLQEKIFKPRLKVLVNRHVQLMNMVTTIERSFSFVIMAQTCCMCVMVCCLGFQILGIFGNNHDRPSILQILTLSATLITSMMHTFVDCFASETLASNSAGIFGNVYDGIWYFMFPQNIRDLIPILMMSKTPRQLTAGKIFYLSMVTYCSILKSSAGYMSMLIAVNSR